RGGRHTGRRIPGARHADARRSEEDGNVMKAGASPIFLKEVAADLEEDRASPRATQSLRRRDAPLASTARQLAMLAAVPLAREGRRVEFDGHAGRELTPARLEIFQVNLGKLCNMT